jgi:hypothetical protein
MKQFRSFHHMTSEIQTEPSKEHPLINFKEIGKNMKKNILL